MSIQKITTKTSSDLAGRVLEFMNKNKLVLSGDFVTTPSGVKYNAVVKRLSYDFYDGTKKLQEVGLQKRGSRYPEPFELSGSSIPQILEKFARKTSNKVLAFVDCIESFSLKVPNFFQTPKKVKETTLMF